MAARRPVDPNHSRINPNVDSAPDENARQAEWMAPDEANRQEAVREQGRMESTALDETMTKREADARREVPKTDKRSLNPRKARALPSPGARRSMLSSRMKKDYSRTKTGWVRSMPQNHHAAMQKTLKNRESLEQINRALHSVVGMRSELSPAIARRVGVIDRTIQSYERNNEREHIVYTTLRAPSGITDSRDAMIGKLRDMISDKGTLTFDSYIPATHSLGNIAESPEVVMEIRTTSGAYLGTSDTTPDANHIIGRGRVLRPVSVQEAEYVKPDGSQGSRLVVQMEDVTPE